MKKVESEIQDCPYAVGVRDGNEFACIWSSSFQACDASLTLYGETSHLVVGGLFGSSIFDLFGCSKLRLTIPVYNVFKSERRSCCYIYKGITALMVPPEVIQDIEDKVESGKFDRRQGVGNLILLELWPDRISSIKDAPQFKPKFCRKICELASEDKLEIADYNQGVVERALEEL